MRVTRGAHTLKGGASSFKASKLVEVAEIIESLGKEHKFDQIPEQVTTLKREAAVLDDELRHFLESVSTN